MELKYSNKKEIFHELEEDGVLALSFEIFNDIPFVNDAFSSRIGGVSAEEFTSMNLSFARGDNHLGVYENFRRITKGLGATPEDVVFCKQTHTNNVVRVDKSHTGKLRDFYNECVNDDDIRMDHSEENIAKVYAFEEVDGMVTNTPGVCLFTSYADCVPLYFVDPVNRAIGLSHSGWRGTVGKIGAVTVETMIREFGSNPKDIVATVGPCICQDCYEVSKDVIEAFLNEEKESSIAEVDSCNEEQSKNVSSKKWSEESVASFADEKANGKYQLDLRKANEIIFLESGILSENIAVTNVCTACNHEVLFSHRVSKGKRGNLGAFLMIKKESRNAR